ncbi:MAG: metalloregulator ArsR/SmtB family transcription factor [Acidimicrobiales bacterium]
MAEVTKMRSQSRSQPRRVSPTSDRAGANEECCPSVTTAPMGEAVAVDLARVLAALADPVRLRLLSIVASGAEVCSCDLEGPLAKSQPTISHHTRVLADAGLIVGEKRGRWVWWHADPRRLAAVRTALGG